MAEAKHYQEALANYDRAISPNPSDAAVALTPQDARAHFYRAGVHLLKGDFERGWEDFEWRFKIEGSWMAAVMEKLAKPYWTGKEVIISVQAPLIRILGSLGGVS